jgi:glycosyltransferase involved in cell wall biosynthesis
LLKRPERLVLLTNVPTPYRIAFFNVLHGTLQEYGAALTVLYCAEREPHRRWEVRLQDQSYPWRVLPGIHPTCKGWYPHLNPAIRSTLRELRPRWLMVAGAWNTPTMLLTVPRGLTSPAEPHIFWSEGHASAVLHPEGLIAGARRRVLSRYDAFAVPNGPSADFIRREVGPAAVILPLPNTVDDVLFGSVPEQDRSLLCRHYGLPDERVLFTVVAQLEERKGVLELSAAFEMLRPEDRRRAALVFVGDGSLRSNLSERARQLDPGSICVLGQLPQAEVRDVLAASDAFVLPTKRDPNPLSAIEAAFAGLPIIISRQAGNALDLVQAGRNGWLLETATPELIAEALRKFMRCTPETRRRMGRLSRDIAERGFRRDNVARRFVESLLAAFPP